MKSKNTFTGSTAWKDIEVKDHNPKKGTLEFKFLDVIKFVFGAICKMNH